MYKLSFVIICIAFCGCYIESQRRQSDYDLHDFYLLYRSNTTKYIGQHKSELITDKGTPTSILNDGLGGEFIEYDKSYKEQDKVITNTTYSGNEITGIHGVGFSAYTVPPTYANSTTRFEEGKRYTIKRTFHTDADNIIRETIVELDGFVFYYAKPPYKRLVDDEETAQTRHWISPPRQ